MNTRIAMQILERIIKVNAVELNYSNLARLAVFLNEADIPDEKFSMSHYLVHRTQEGYIDDLSVPPKEASEKINECGSCACAAGWGPFAGIPAGDNDTNWDAYIRNNFVDQDAPSAFFFSSYWNNDRKMAAKRIAYVLTYGRCIENVRHNEDMINALMEYYEPNWSWIKQFIPVTESPSPEQPSQSESIQS